MRAFDLHGVRRRGDDGGVVFVGYWIPAFAGMTVGTRMTVGQTGGWRRGLGSDLAGYGSVAFGSPGFQLSRE